MLHQFPIEEFTQVIRLGKREELLVFEDPSGLVAHIRSFVATGRQIRTEVSSDRHVEKTCLVPASNWDWVKKTIIDFEPTLNFGWLKPKYKTINTNVHVIKHFKISNVYPLELETANRKAYVDLVSIPEPVDWLLSSEPPTPEEVNDTEKQIVASKFMSRLRAREAAAFLSDHLYSLSPREFQEYWWKSSQR